MPFKKGHKKVGGRTKGTPNSLTKELRVVLKEIVFNEMKNFPKYVEGLPNEKKIEVFLTNQIINHTSIVKGYTTPS